MSVDGLISVRCTLPVKEVTDRLVALITSKGMTVFARIDHAANATVVGLALRPTELVIFGNPKAGTSLMVDQQTSAIDLPVKALAWEDEDGAVWLSYNDAAWLAHRHGLGAASAAIVEAIRVGLAALTTAAGAATSS